MPAGHAVCALVSLIALRATPDWGWLRELLSPGRLIVSAFAIGMLGFAKTALWQKFLPNKSFEEDTEKMILAGALAVAALIALAVLRIGSGWFRRGGAWAALMSEMVALVLVGYLGHVM